MRPPAYAIASLTLPPVENVQRVEPVAALKRIDLAVPVADVDHAVDDERRGLARADRHPPAHLPRVGVQRHHPAVEPGAARVAGRLVQEGHVDRMAVDGRRRRGAAAGAVGPDRPHLRDVDGEERPVRVGEVELPVGDRGRELDQRMGTEEPQRPVRRLHQHLRRVALPRRVEAVHRPADLAARGRRDRLLLGGDELLGRGATHVPALMLPVEANSDERLRRSAAPPRRPRSGPSSPGLVLDGVEPRKAVQEKPPRVAGDRDEGAVRKAEDLPARARVQAVDPVLAVAEVDDAVHDRRRSGDSARGREAPVDRAGARGERVEGAVVGAEVDAAVPDRPATSRRTSRCRATTAASLRSRRRSASRRSTR